MTKGIHKQLPDVFAELPYATKMRIENLSRGLLEHSLRACDAASLIAQIHQIDISKSKTAALCHDLARQLKPGDLIRQADIYNLDVHPIEYSNPILLHGPVAALWLEHEDGITDHEVLEAIRWHTTGKPNMNPIGKVAFLADKLDVEKMLKYPKLERVHALADENLDKAILKFLDLQLEFLSEKDLLIHPITIELRNDLLVKLDTSKMYE